MDRHLLQALKNVDPFARIVAALPGDIRKSAFLEAVCSRRIGKFEELQTQAAERCPKRTQIRNSHGHREIINRSDACFSMYRLHALIYGEIHYDPFRISLRVTQKASLTLPLEENLPGPYLFQPTMPKPNRTTLFETIAVQEPQPASYLLHTVCPWRMNMEKQLTFFGPEEDDSVPVWQSLPEENRQKIESVFVQILIRYLSASVEVKNCEK